VPLLVDLAKTPEDRLALKLLSAPVAMGRPLFAAPGVPRERIDALRRAFDKTMKDPAFLAQARKQRLAIDPVSGTALQSLVAEILAAPKPVTGRLAKILGALQTK
jgi:tripartite-type tricarboxylate transporter receptor subunit TctC